MNWILDTNIFINAVQKYYGLDLCPGFWQWLLQHTDCIYTIDMVEEELADKDDELFTWCKEQLPSSFFRHADEEVMSCYKKVVSHVMALPDPPFNQNKKDDFINGADPMLIAFAMKTGDVLVTNEKFNPDAHKKIYLPNIAKEFDVKFTDIFDVMRRLEAKLVLEQ